MPSFEYH